RIVGRGGAGAGVDGRAAARRAVISAAMLAGGTQGPPITRTGLAERRGPLLRGSSVGRPRRPMPPFGAAPRPATGRLAAGPCAGVRVGRRIAAVLPTRLTTTFAACRT